MKIALLFISQIMQMKTLPANVRDLLAQMITNQNNLNNTAYSHTWLEKAKSGEWNYLIAASQEIAEFTNSFWLPWWSKSEQDLINCRIELVDALHFMLSALIASVDDEETRVEILTTSLDAMIDELKDVEKLDTIGLIQLMQISLNQAETDMFTVFFALAQSIDFDVEKIYSLYMGKSTLNQFRQDKGYKLGTYVKKWDGVNEDNHFMAVWVSEQDVAPTTEQIRSFLDVEYAKYVK